MCMDYFAHLLFAMYHVTGFFKLVIVLHFILWSGLTLSDLHAAQVLSLQSNISL